LEEMDGGMRCTAYIEKTCPGSHLVMGLFDLFDVLELAQQRHAPAYGYRVPWAILDI